LSGLWRSSTTMWATITINTNNTLFTNRQKCQKRLSCQKASEFQESTSETFSLSAPRFDRTWIRFLW
jgi:hypothetical protein